MYQEGDSNSGTESFGPGTDLVMSLLAVMILVAMVMFFVQEFFAAVDTCPTCDVCPEPPQNLFTLNRTDSKSLFDAGDDQLKPSGESDLDLRAEEILSGLKNRKYDFIEIVGYASPSLSTKNGIRVTDGGQGESYPVDYNLDLSALRATSVAHYLHRKGVPYECMQVSGWGRARSAFRDKYVTRYKISYDDFDVQEPWMETDVKNDKHFYEEQRVEIHGITLSLSERKTLYCSLSLK